MVSGWKLGSPTLLNMPLQFSLLGYTPLLVESFVYVLQYLTDEVYVEIISMQQAHRKHAMKQEEKKTGANFMVSEDWLKQQWLTDCKDT